MHPLPSSWAGIALAVVLTGCGLNDSSQVSSHHYRSAAEVQAALASGPQRLRATSLQLQETHRDFERFSRSNGSRWRNRGYMDARESDHMEQLLFRFVTAQNTLTDLIGALGGGHPSKLFPSERLKTQAHLLVVDTEFVLIHHRCELVAEFAKDPVAIAKLNEAFFRSEIPKGTYDALRLKVTAPDTSRRLNAAWILYEQQSQSPEVRELLASDPDYARLAKQTPDNYQRARQSLAEVRGRPIPSALTHTEAAALARKARGGFGNFKYKARSLLFKDVSRIGSPRRKVISFSEDQHRQVDQLLQPGDIVLTYTAGFMSNVFIPGHFKHGITYVGSPAQRKAAGVSIVELPDVAAPEQARVASSFSQADLDDGQPFDVIEAVAEGVIFNNLAHLMDTHVNRMAVLRPRLDRKNKAAFISDVFAYHGDPYDFLFDFGDASRQVCTEVIYRGLNGRQGIDFPLTVRGGHPNLSADDLINYHFQTDGRHFEFVLYAEQDPSRSGHRAIIHTGTTGEEELKRQMAGSPSKN